MKLTPLKMWLQNVMPVVYDDSLSYYEAVGKINEKTNEIIKQVNENTDAIEALNYVIGQLGDIDELKSLLEQVEIIVEDLYTTDTPVMDSESGSAGVAEHAARSDHSHPSDTSKADKGLGITGSAVGKFVKVKTVDENNVPTEFESDDVHSIPSGGTTAQVLKKQSAEDYAAGWYDVHEVPFGGNAGYILTKRSGTDFDIMWGENHPIPAGGNTGQVLKKSSGTDYAAGWADEHPIPAGGNAGQVLKKSSGADYAVGWGDEPDLNSVAEDVAIVIDGNTTSYASAIPAGQYVIVRNSTIAGKSDGLYKTVAVIPVGTQVNSAQLGSKINFGGINEVNELYKFKDTVMTFTQGVRVEYGYFVEDDNCYYVNANIQNTTGSTISVNYVVAKFPENCKGGYLIVPGYPNGNGFVVGSDGTIYSEIELDNNAYAKIIGFIAKQK